MWVSWFHSTRARCWLSRCAESTWTIQSKHQTENPTKQNTTNISNKVSCLACKIPPPPPPPPFQSQRQVADLSWICLLEICSACFKSYSSCAMRWRMEVISSPLRPFGSMLRSSRSSCSFSWRRSNLKHSDMSSDSYPLSSQGVTIHAPLYTWAHRHTLLYSHTHTYTHRYICTHYWIQVYTLCSL